MDAVRLSVRGIVSGRHALITLGAFVLSLSAGTASAQAEALSARALIVAQKEAKLAAPLDGLITKINVEIGDRFKAGTLLVAFDCTELEAARRRGAANLKAAQITLTSKRRLVRYKAAGQTEVDLAAADVAKAKAGIDEIDARLKRCTVQAPFDGRVASIDINAHESVSRGTVLMSIVGRRVRLRILVPSAWLRWMKPGSPFSVRIEETKKSYPARVYKVSARVDAASQRIEILGRLAGPAPDLLPGMSGIAVFSRPGQGRSPAQANQ